MFARNTFQRQIRDYCKRLGLKLQEIDDTHATLVFTMPSGREQFLYIVPFQSTLEFSVPSVVGADQLEDMPHELSTRLLQRSATKKVGFWCIERIAGVYVYSYMHNVETQLIDSDYFGTVIASLVQECEEFETWQVGWR